MSFNSIALAAVDTDLQVRVQACANREASLNPNLKDTQFAIQVRNGFANYTGLYWNVAGAVEAEYESGMLAGRGAPGHDIDVVTDGAILAAVQMHWPPDVVPPTPPEVTPPT